MTLSLTLKDVILGGKTKPPSPIMFTGTDSNFISSGSQETTSRVGGRAWPFCRALPPKSTWEGKVAAHGSHLPTWGPDASPNRASCRDGERSN